MPTCAIYGCDNRTETIRGTEIRLHSFPKERSKRLKWVSRCKRKDTFKTNSYRICSIHFSKEDYERDLKAELLNLDRKPMLKKDAIPHLNLTVDLFERNDPDVPPKKVSKSRNTRNSKRVLQETTVQKTEIERSVLVDQALKEVPSVTPIGEVNDDYTHAPSDSNSPSEEVDYKELYLNSLKRINSLQEENERLLEELATYKYMKILPESSFAWMRFVETAK